VFNNNNNKKKKKKSKYRACLRVQFLYFAVIRTEIKSYATMQNKKKLFLIKSRTEAINKAVTLGDANTDSFIIFVLIFILLF